MAWLDSPVRFGTSPPPPPYFRVASAYGGRAVPSTKGRRKGNQEHTERQLNHGKPTQSTTDTELGHCRYRVRWGWNVPVLLVETWALLSTTRKIIRRHFGGAPANLGGANLLT